MPPVSLQFPPASAAARPWQPVPATSSYQLPPNWQPAVSAVQAPGGASRPHLALSQAEQQHYRMLLAKQMPAGAISRPVVQGRQQMPELAQPAGWLQEQARFAAHRPVAPVQVQAALTASQLDLQAMHAAAQQQMQERQQARPDTEQP